MKSTPSEFGTQGNHFLKTKVTLFDNVWGILITGALLGVVFALLSYVGNPANMGFCSICFVRDTAGAFGLHNFQGGMYIRPEFLGIVFGALLGALGYGEFKAKAANNGLISFILGTVGMCGALIFLGCPWRAIGRLAGGDLTAVSGICGLIIGIFIASIFLIKGFSLGEKKEQPSLNKWIFPAIVGIITAVFVAIQMGWISTSPALFNELPPFETAPKTGPAALHAPILYSILGGLLLGFLIQRSRFCTVGAFRDIFLFKRFHFFWGVLIFLGVGMGVNLALGQFKFGIEGQPFAHNFTALSFMAMCVAGMAFTFAGGCPGRQIVLAAQGDGNAVMFVLGMVGALPLVQGFNLWKINPQTVPVAWGFIVATGILVLLIAFFTREKN